MEPVMTMAEVAAYFRHDAPESEAGAAFVRRLMRRGLPAMRGMRPIKFLRRQVEAFAAELATGLELEPPRDRKPRRAASSRGKGCGASPIQERLDKMRSGR